MTNVLKDAAGESPGQTHSQQEDIYQNIQATGT